MRGNGIDTELYSLVVEELMLRVEADMGLTSSSRVSDRKSDAAK